MRVVRLDIEDERLEFHPYVTVVRGLHRRHRGQLLLALEALASGEAVADGIVEAHGVFLDLSEDTLAMLDLGKPGVDDVDLVVRPDQLPGPLGLGALGRKELDRRREKIAADVVRVEAELERAQLELATSRQAGDIAEGSAGHHPSS